MYGIYENGKVIAKFTAPLTLRSNHPVTVSDTLSLKRLMSRRSAQRWEIEAGIEPLVSSAADLMVSLVTKGPTEAVQVLVPQNYAVRLKRRLDYCTADGTAMSSFVNITNHVGFIPKGTFVRLWNHSKIYMATQDLQGDGVLQIYPPLLKTVVAQPLRSGDDVIMTCLFDTDVVRGMTYSDGILMNVGTIRLIEKL